MAEEGEIAYTASTSAPQIFSEEEDNDTDEEMIVVSVDAAMLEVTYIYLCLILAEHCRESK